jgi:pyrrolysine biosynthesis protein PylC
MRVAIVGGRLQGLEAVYLADEAGYDLALIDKDAFAPARSLVDEFYHLDVLQDENASIALLREFDFILPATENYPTLAWLNEAARKIQIPLALDLSAYTISSSKIKSNQLFSSAGIPTPASGPDCGFPLIVKPSNSSGSTGVVKVADPAQLEAILTHLEGETVVQKYLEGPSYSLEVLARHGSGTGIQVTQLEFDSDYDCKRVLAGPNTGKTIAQELFDLGIRIADILGLSGILDIEVIDTGNQLKVLEIDARLPSQTPSAVYHSTGVNMVEMLAQCWTESNHPDHARFSGPERAVILEHYRYKGGVLEVVGEHVLADARGLKVYKDMFSANVLLSNFERLPQDWVATAIYIADTETQVWESRNRALQQIQHKFQSKAFLDPVPFE